MNHRVEITATAREELGKIVNWIHHDSPARALRWLDRFRSRIKTLRESPLRCPLAPENALFVTEFRHLIVGKGAGQYRIIFFIQDDVVYISHVRHSAMRPFHE
ncbi:MAG: type II toxin-antitoxin system RelE/ParE family toxin [bacterium]|nr:type II toxin-antitoxin system RelE/ParE family toxin [bacterium]